MAEPREVMVSNSVLANRDGVRTVNVGDAVQMVETEKGLRSVNPRDRNAKLVNMRVTQVKESRFKDRHTGKWQELQHVTLTEES